MGFVVDAQEGCARGFEVEGFFYAGDEFWIGIPTVGDVFGFVAACAEVDGCAFESARWCARDAAISFDEVFEAAFGVGGGLLALFFVGNVDEEFDDATVFAFRNLVVEGMDDYAPLTQAEFVKLGVVYIAGEAGVIPEEQTTRAVGWDLVFREHAVEVVAACCGAA